MRSLAAAASVSLVLLACSAALAEESPRANAVQADLGLAVVHLDYERTLSSYVALQVGAGLFGIWWASPKFTGFGGELRASFFLAGTAPQGVYVAPFVRVDVVTTKVGSDGGTGVGSSEGAFAGYSFALGERWNLRVGAGAQYMRYAATVDGAQVEWKKPYPALDLVLGYAF